MTAARSRDECSGPATIGRFWADPWPMVVPGSPEPPLTDAVEKGLVIFGEP